MPERKRKWEYERDLQFKAIALLRDNVGFLDSYEINFVAAAAAALRVGSLTKRQKRFLGELASRFGFDG